MADVRTALARITDLKNRLEARLTSAEGDISTNTTGLSNHLADTSDAHDGSAISVADAGGYFTGTDVEAVLQELGADLSAISASGTYTPTTSVTVGTGGTNTGEYVEVDGIMVAWGKITLGTSPTVTSPTTVALPSGYEFASSTDRPVGWLRCVDPGSAGYPGYLRVASSTTAQLFVYDSSGTYVIDDNVSSVVPMSWASSDRMEWALVAQVTRV